MIELRTAKNNVDRILGETEKEKIVTDNRRRVDDFSLPVGNSRRRRRLKKPGALAPGFTGVWGRSATNKHAPGIYRRIACQFLRTYGGLWYC